MCSLQDTGVGQEEQLLGLLFVPIRTTLWDAWLIQQDFSVP